jgi:hypothetical protein
MMGDVVEKTQAAAEISRLEKIVGGDPGAPAFPALAEAHRRAGSPLAAERIAREGLHHRPAEVAGRVALGLALLDQGRGGEARAEFERILDAVPEHLIARAALESQTEAGSQVATSDSEAAREGFGGLDDAELETAFEAARPETDAMLDANRAAARAVQAFAAGDEEEGGEEEEREFAPAPESPFATRTVADLLEQQGHPESAADLRERLVERPTVETTEAGPRPARANGHTQRVLATLERWLEKLRTGSER